MARVGSAPWVWAGAAPTWALALVVACARSDTAPPPGAAAPAEAVSRSVSGAPQGSTRKPDGPVEICVGEAHSCLRTGSGKVACWGDNVDRQAAPLDTPQLDAPSWLGELPPSASVRCEARQTCVRTQAGDVYCLGGTSRAEKLALPGPAIDLALHRGGGCALLASGRAWCWAQPPPYRSDPVARVEGNVASRSPWVVPGVPMLARFGASPALARVVCGTGDSGPICLQNAALPDTVSLSAVDPLLRGASDVVAVGTDGDALCGVFPDRTLRCAGEGRPGELGDLAALRVADASSAGDTRAAPAIAAYEGGLCFAAEGGDFRCAGAPNALARAIPKRASSAALGASHACAIVDGEVSCWGSASSGQLGNGQYVHATALQVPGIEDAVGLDVNESQACVVLRSGGVSCWGALSRQGAAVDLVFAPRPLPVAHPALEVRAAHRGPSGTDRELEYRPTCLRDASGWSCWERGEFRRAKLLDATPLSRWKVSPAQFSPDRQCAVTSKGALVCAGEPSFTGTNRTIKTALLRFEGGARPFAEATSLFSVAGTPHVCGRTASGQVSCYAATSATTAAAVAAPKLAALSDIVSVRAAGFGEDGAACALARNGTVSCWGEGRWSQVPGARPRSAWDPVEVSGMPPAAEIAVGGSFACARATSGKVYCWGSNRFGAAPNGLSGSSTEPLAVQGL